MRGNLRGRSENTYAAYFSADMLIPLTQVLFGAVFGNGATHVSEYPSGVS
jgi:hypothetical protein